ncbi:hypothetical protein, partial [Tsukamurella pulmonis]|uniref:hypothetical protein n=1 Tax=Tsukamurella pulmonis TaxID=47312 RepID=UPI000E12A11F
MARRFAHALSLSVLGALVAGSVLAAPANATDPSTVPTAEERLYSAGDVPERLVTGAGFERFARDLDRALDRARTVDEAERAAYRLARELWSAAVRRARSGTGGFASDDRPLYWARLAM